MSAKDLKDLDTTQLNEREAELRKHLFDLKTQSATEKVKDTSEFQKIKKDIARIKTLLTQQKAKQPQQPMTQPVSSI